MHTLASLLSPYDVNKFLTEYWTQKALFISGGGIKKFENLFSWDKLTYILNFHELNDSSLTLIKEGKILRTFSNQLNEKNSIIKSLQKGATLKLDNIHKKTPEIDELVANLKQDMPNCEMHVNTYCSWPDKQGFDYHYDTYEVFVLQIEGKKEWYVFPDTYIKYPVQYTISASSIFTLGEPYLTRVLNPGDLLYIPRGHLHYAVACEEPSLHLTLGIRCPTGIDFLQWLAQKLRQKEEWRQSLPLVKDNVSTTYGEHLESLFQNLISYISDQEIQAEYLDSIKKLEQPTNAYSLPYQAGFNIFPQGINTIFKRPSWQRAITSIINENEYKVRVGNKEVILKPVNEDFVQNLFSQESFTGSNVASWLPGMDWESEVVPILSYLVMEGIIFVDAINL